MSWPFTRPERLAGVVNVGSTMMNDAARYRPFMETWTAERLPWARTGAVPSFERFPPPERFGPLLAEFAQTA